MLSVTYYPSPEKQTALDLLLSVPGTDNNDSIFVSQSWLCAWLESLPNAPDCYLFNCNERIVGLAFTGKQPFHRRIPIIKSCLLNQLGDTRADQHWVEYNTVYCASDMFKECAELLLDTLFKTRRHAEFYISMSHQCSQWLDMAKARSAPYDYQTVIGRVTRLTEPYRQVDTLLAKLSKNSRAQMRRSIRQLKAECGDIEVTVASADEQDVYFRELGNTHINQWAHTPEGSGFANPIFLAHHQYLFDHYPENVCILKVQAGDMLLGYSYYVISQSTAYFYCAGITPEIPNKHIKPGYMLHIYAMVYFAQRGFKAYDFLGGDAQYKKTLATESYQFHNISIYNPSPFTRCLLKAKQTVKRWMRSP